MQVSQLSQVTSVNGSELIPLSDSQNGNVLRSASINTIKDYIAPSQLPINYAAAYPTTTDIEDGQALVWKNTATGVVRLYVNDSGVMKFVELT